MPNKNRTHLSFKPRLPVPYRLIEELIPYANNPRQHSRNQIKKLQRSLEQFGWINALIVDASNNLICGHGRLEAARQMGETEVPVISLGEMSEADRRAYIIADNQLATESSWSKQLLHSELKGLIELGYEVELTGFDTLEIDMMISIGDEAPQDDVVHLPDEKTVPICRVGDLWHIGEHRLIVDDARDPAVYDRLLDGARAQLIVTDPPYGCAISNNVSGLGKVRHDNFVMGAGEQSLPEFAHPPCELSANGSPVLRLRRCPPILHLEAHRRRCGLVAAHRRSHEPPCSSAPASGSSDLPIRPAVRWRSV